MLPLKQHLLRLLPRSVLQGLRRWHAPRVAARFTDADWPVASIVRALVKPGDVVIDVGANIGYITARLAYYVGPSGRVYSIEAVPDTFELLQRTVRHLDLKQVTPLHACATSAPGEVEMEIPRYAHGVENLYESHVTRDHEQDLASSSARRVRVPAARLDDLIPALAQGRARSPSGPEFNPLSTAEPITFIKIDVEGHEWDVLRGAEQLLNESHPPLYIEVAGDPDEPGAQAAQLFRWLDERGYSPYVCDQARLIPRRTGDASVDYFFLQPAQTEGLEALGHVDRDGTIRNAHTILERHKA